MYQCQLFLPSSYSAAMSWLSQFGVVLLSHIFVLPPILQLRCTFILIVVIKVMKSGIFTFLSTLFVICHFHFFKLLSLIDLKNTKVKNPKKILLRLAAK
jgi:hypothetical protein